MLKLMLVFLLAIFILEAPGVMKRKQWREIAVISLFILLAVTYGLDYALQLYLMPNPKELIYTLYPLTQQFWSFFNISQ
ncbi:MAG: hypothetical protein ACOX6E_01650 [Syntrophomonadaceae bacterium]|jgi:hypothetical protein